eukprot:529846-Lingulodinium_polyedra.AAC.1
MEDICERAPASALDRMQAQLAARLGELAETSKGLDSKAAMLAKKDIGKAYFWDCVNILKT